MSADTIPINPACQSDPPHRTKNRSRGNSLNRSRRTLRLLMFCLYPHSPTDILVCFIWLPLKGREFSAVISRVLYSQYPEKILCNTQRIKGLSLHLQPWFRHLVSSIWTQSVICCGPRVCLNKTEDRFAYLESILQSMNSTSYMTVHMLHAQTQTAHALLFY